MEDVQIEYFKLQNQKLNWEIKALRLELRHQKTFFDIQLALIKSELGKLTILNELQGK